MGVVGRRNRQSVTERPRRGRGFKEVCHDKFTWGCC